jgi:hypothetical protein
VISKFNWPLGIMKQQQNPWIFIDHNLIDRWEYHLYSVEYHLALPHWLMGFAYTFSLQIFVQRKWHVAPSSSCWIMHGQIKQLCVSHLVVGRQIIAEYCRSIMKMRVKKCGYRGLEWGPAFKNWMESTLRKLEPKAFTKAKQLKLDALR